MGKRSDGKFERRPHDRYDTPRRACWPLLHHVPAGTKYAELCAGKGDLIRHLAEDDINCVFAVDLHPRAPGIGRADALKLKRSDLPKSVQMNITNPPWTRAILHPMIENFLHMGLPTWLLFDADWAHNVEESPQYISYCRKIVSVGRVKWIAGSKSAGVDNAAWYLFDGNFKGNPTFHIRRGG